MKTYIKRIVLLAIALVIGSAGQLGLFPASVSAAAMEVATARVNITPNAIGFPTYYRGGYGSNAVTNITSGATLSATGLLIVDGLGQKWVMVSADVLAFPSSVTSSLQAMAQTKYGIAPQRLLLAGTHTHSGPVLVDQPDLYVTYGIAPGSAQEQLVQAYTAAFENKIDELLAQLTSAETVEASATYAIGAANGAYNRASARYTATDPSVPTLTLRNATTNRVLAVVFSYAMHAVSLGIINQWNPDYPGATTAMIESQLASANPGVRALFIPGAAGDQNPVAGLTPATIASRLAPQVVAAVEGAYGTGSISVLGPQSSSVRDLQLPLDINVNLTTLRNRYANVAATAPAGANKRHAELMVNQINAGTLRTSMHEKITTWTFATAGSKPLALIAMAGEPTVDFAIGFGNLLDDQFIPWTVGYTNGHPGYIPSDEILKRGSNCPQSGCAYNAYESGWATIEGGQKYPLGSSVQYNDGLPAPLRTGADNAVCAAVVSALSVSADCAQFTPGRLIQSPALNASAGAGMASWTDASGSTHVEMFALGTNTCLQHRTWTGNNFGGLNGQWSTWDPAGICGGIVGPVSAEAWVDSAGRARIEVAVRTGDGSLFHGRCVGDQNGCFNKTWQWQQLGAPSDQFVESPDLALWKDQDGRMRMDVYAVQGSGRCVKQRTWLPTDTLGNGSWQGWSQDPGCGGVVGQPSATVWRSGNTVYRDVVVRTGAALFMRRCSGPDTSCTWGQWMQISGPGSVSVIDAPAYTASFLQGTGRHDLLVRGNDNCIWQASWTSLTVPTSPGWSKIGGCGLSSRPGATAWLDNFGRHRVTVAAMGYGTGTPLWVNNLISRTSNPQQNVWTDWEDIADQSAWVANP